MKRVLLAALVGGLLMFVWGAVSHMVLPLGQAGIETLPDEEAVLGPIRTSINEPGFYFFPGMDMSGDATAEEQADWQARYRSGPTGILVVHPEGAEPLSPKLLASEAGANVLAALIAALVLAGLAGGYGTRVALVAALGLFAWLSISLSYWIWYGFPGAYVGAELVDQVVGWLIAGLAMAKIVPPPAG